MKLFSPKKPNLFYSYSLFLLFFIFLLNQSCNNDIDEFENQVLANTIKNDKIDESLENLGQQIQPDSLLRFFTVLPTHDAFIQNDGKGINKRTLRLKENTNSSYLKFDLSSLETIADNITDVYLDMASLAIGEEGHIKVYKAQSSDWVESELSYKNAPILDVDMGAETSNHPTQPKGVLKLNVNELLTEVITLVLEYRDGDNVIFLSKENEPAAKPKLVIAYKTRSDSQESFVDNEPLLEHLNGIIGQNNIKSNPLQVKNSLHEAGPFSNLLLDLNTKEPIDSKSEVLLVNEKYSSSENISKEQNETIALKSTITSKGNTTPTAIITANATTGKAPFRVWFTGNKSTDDKAVVSYLWKFKDGRQNATIANPAHTFEKPGTYNVELTVKDQEGVSHSSIIKIVATNSASSGNSAPKALIIADKTFGKAPFRVRFTGNTSTDDKKVVSYLWKFKDGRQNATIANPAHTFEKPGTYNVELTVKDAEGLASTKTITITATNSNNTAPVAIVTADKTSGAAPFRVRFTGNKSTDDKKIVSYLWQFKDGKQNATIENPAHTFVDPGTYIVELTVKDAEGLSHKKSITITATGTQNQAPKAVINADITSGQAPLRVRLSANKSTDDNAITSYLWKFKDGEQNATITSPAHTFVNPGTYNVELTVTDAQGLSDTTTISISANQGSQTNAPESSYFVTTNGSSNNDGSSESKAWSITHALQNAKAGDYVFIKAGNYGNVTLNPGNSGTAGKPIRFIGYKQVPGDITAGGGSTFNYGNQLDPNKMPLLKGKRSNYIGQGTGIYNFRNYVQFSNIQITQYGEGVFSSGDHTVFDNIIVTDIGDFNPAHTYPDNTSNQSLNYKGIGIKISGDYAEIKNCFVLNAGAEGYRFSECRYQKHSYNKAYSDSKINPCDYYYLLGIGAKNNDVSNIYVERVGDLEHAGHGLVLKVSAQNNQIRNSTVKNTWLELSYSNVSGNTFTNCSVIGGANNNGALLIANGAHNNTFNQCKVTNCDGVSFSDWNESVSLGDVNNAGHHNTFNQCTFDNNLAGVNFFWYSQNNKQYKAHDNTFDNCTFRNMDQLFMVDRVNSNTMLKNCSIINVDKLKDSFYPTVNSGISLNAQFQNNLVQSSGFTLN